MTNNTDWRALPAGAALDRVIAEQLGYTYVHPSPDVYQLVSSSGEVIKWAANQYFNLTPRYSTDANAALALALPPEHSFEVGGYASKWTATIFYKYAIDISEYASADSPALVICRAWLAWKAAPGSASARDGEKP